MMTVRANALDMNAAFKNERRAELKFASMLSLNFKPLSCLRYKTFRSNRCPSAFSKCGEMGKARVSYLAGIKVPGRDEGSRD